MRNRYITLVLFFVLLSTSSVLAQRYGTSAGLRLGNNDVGRTIGLTIQQRVLKHVTIEGILQSDFNRNSSLHLLLERHHPIISKRFNYYYGGGLSLGREESFVKNRDTKEIIQTYGNVTSGIDLIGGIEMTIASTTISIDYMPNFNMAGREEFFRGQVGISARMVLVKGREQNKKWRKKSRDKKRRNKRNTSPFFENLKEKFKKN